ncbi:gas vesicle protein GvpO [Actinacidiphila oryziradicis]|nr:gas vesicle protein [Actinacidiphila oryziradicis]
MDWSMAAKDGKDDDPGVRISMPEAMRAATAQLSELLQSEPGGVSALKSTDRGWTANVEVVEIARIPDTTSVMASYRVDLDGRGRIVAYERTHRYARGQVDR